ncbi:MAG: hypothetical protein CBC13_05640 [Planctomycetia bacterium TMED53]|nr:MAG: hypothetical protein CBC13_05640 [Planctomycetia bacterium TMED53]
MSLHQLRILILESEYTGEINARLGVSEWLGAEMTRVSLSEAQLVIEGTSDPAPYQNHDILIGGTGEDTSSLGLKLADQVGSPMTVFLASILPDDLDPDILRYDLIVAPPHSQLSGDRVLTILGVPHKFRPSPLTKNTCSEPPKLALLLGGNTRYCDGFTPEYASRLGDRLLRQADLWNGKFTITNSRRTPVESLIALRKILSNVEEEFIDWTESGSEGYQNILDNSDIIFCTGDSLSMCCEAAITGKPLLVTCDEEALEIYHADTIRRLVAAGHAHIFNSPVVKLPQPVQILDPTKEVGLKISELLKARRQIQR